MDQRHYIEIKPFRIYALLLQAEENFIYIGKTTARRMSAVYSRHRTGSVKATACYFDQEKPPQMYLLQTCNVTASEAYRRVVAWCHLFLQAGYAGINHERTLSQARNLLPKTKQIVQSLMQEPLPDILRRTYLEHPSDADLIPERQAVAEVVQKKIQMNIRIGTRDKNRFDRFCRKGGLNQREGFSLLLDRVADSESHPAMAALLKEREEKIAQLKQENSRYKAKLADSGSSRKETALEKKLEFQRTGIQQYLQMLFPEKEGNASLPETSWRRYMRQFSEDEKPRYPAQEGFMLLQPEMIVWGNSLHRPCFLVGKGADEKRYLLRCYPRRDFIGIPIREFYRVEPGTLCYVGYQQSQDGAMELLMALPLLWGNEENIPKKGAHSDVLEGERRKVPLDRVIQDARRKG